VKTSKVAVRSLRPENGHWKGSDLLSEPRRLGDAMSGADSKAARSSNVIDGLYCGFVDGIAADLSDRALPICRQQRCRFVSGGTADSP
jgi:hypothetical protein